MISSSATAKEWDEVRSTFATSIMVDTPLSSLAQNLDGPDWPLTGANETPAAYIDLSFDEVVELLALKGQPGERMDQLIGILRDTLAFDDPFGEMVAQGEAAAEKDNPLLKNLAKLEIPADYPINLTALSPETQEFCGLENLSTLSEFAVFAQSMSQSVIVGGDFRGMLNALSHIDEQALAQYLPFRPGSKGLHLIEAVAQAIKAQPAHVQRALGTPNAPVPLAVVDRVGRLSAYFAPEASVLRGRIATGITLQNLVAVLNDPPLELIVVRLLAPHFAPPPSAEPRKRSWWARLLGK
jgi:hypothetical protein